MRLVGTKDTHKGLSTDVLRTGIPSFVHEEDRLFACAHDDGREDIHNGEPDGGAEPRGMFETRPQGTRYEIRVGTVSATDVTRYPRAESEEHEPADHIQ
jgi:hypothetical protein